ncbi:MAG: hypothetical protein JXB32_06065 [Deltaproteobacteria bacterium]|nr:hypothetical protein [Deltaproteobacteria bacterium]
MRHILWGLFVGACLGAFAGCGDDDGGPRDAEVADDGGAAESGDATETADTTEVGDTDDAVEVADGDPGTDPLPEGPTGIAARFPGDVDIATDPDVVFADNFESYGSPDDLWDRWDNVFQMDQTRLAREPANVHGGAQALEFTIPVRHDELSNAVDKVLADELDVLFLRYYSKFNLEFDVVGSSHNGSMISAHYVVDGHSTPGIPADGYNKFLAGFESWRGEAAEPNPGNLNVYIYHPLQRSEWGDHFFPTGLVMPNTSLPFDFGPRFVSRPDVNPELGRWYAYEFMVRANTVGAHDGRIACWLDGVLIADFQNLELRYTDVLRIDRFGLSLHAGSNPRSVARKWYDDVVAATRYVGPRTP